MEKDTTKNNNNVDTPVTDVTPVVPVAAKSTTDTRPQKNPFQNDDRGFKKNERRAPRRESRVKPEFDQKIISIRRVTRVVTGGRRFAFSVALVAGNRKGSVGVGMGKAGDTSLSIDKALRDAKKRMVKINLTKNMSISHEVSAKYCASRVVLMPAPGRGVLVGSSVRNVIELAGIKDINGKLFSRTKNKVNNAKAAIKALSQLRPVKQGAKIEAKAEKKEEVKE
ncbi:MAG: 30S ribosomal protein S5 [Parcubacteria group bacterium]|nr:30S ribosomal protein S5 [Parcubacteria group bacterium]